MTNPLPLAQRTLTRARRAALTEQLAQVRLRLRLLAPVVINAHTGGNADNREADAAQEHEQTEEAARSRDRLGREERELVAAIERVASGDYGTCSRCREPIAERRLLILPATETCVACASKIERDEVRGIVA